MEHALRALFEWLLGEQPCEENQVNTHLGVILAHPELPWGLTQFLLLEVQKKLNQDLRALAGLGEPYVAPDHTAGAYEELMDTVGVMPAVTKKTETSAADKKPAAITPKETRMSTIEAAKNNLVQGAKHGAAYAAGRQVLRVIGEAIPLPAGFDALPEEVQVFAACAAARAIGAKFGQETVVAVADHGMEGASTILFAKLDLHALFERISSIAVAPGGESEPSRPASASRRKS